MRVNRPLMKQSSPHPLEGKADSEGRSRLGRLKRKLRTFKRKLTKEDQQTKIVSNGYLKGQWSQQDLPKIVKKIVDSNPGITSIEIYGTEIRWHTEQNYFDLFPRKKCSGDNPSKREGQ